MTWNRWIREIHRWLSVAFTAAVIINILALARTAKPVVWLGLLVLIPLLLLLLTGLYLFVLPYVARRRIGRPVAEEA